MASALAEIELASRVQYALGAATRSDPPPQEVRPSTATAATVAAATTQEILDTGKHSNAVTQATAEQVELAAPRSPDRWTWRAAILTPNLSGSGFVCVSRETEKEHQ